MTKLIIWGAYPTTLKSVREGVSHIHGLGDSLLWWLSALIPHFVYKGYSLRVKARIRLHRSTGNRTPFT